MFSLDPAVLAFIEAAEHQGRIPFEHQTPIQARKAYRASCALTGPLPCAMAAVQNGLLAGTQIAYRMFRPNGSEVLPALVYLHGGGWVVGDLDTHDGVCRRLAVESGCAVLAIDYRLAPEHEFPAAFDDALLAWRAIGEQAPALGLDPTRLGLAGDSAGAALVASLALACRGNAQLKQPRCQLLFYPVTDLAADSGSYAEPLERVFLTANTMHWFRAHYAPDPDSWSDWRASPLCAEDLQGLPPSWVLTVGHGPLRDEGMAYAWRLAEAGNLVCHLHLPDQMHGLLTQSRVLPAGDSVFAQAAAFARQHLLPRP